MSAWGQAPVSGAWANQVDEEEEANEGQLPPVPGVDKAFPTLPEHSYPSLADGIAIKPSKKERRAKAAPQKMNLSSFLAADKAQQVDLPTAPRERPEGDDGRSKGLGGGFSGYGGDRGGETFIFSTILYTCTAYLYCSPYESDLECHLWYPLAKYTQKSALWWMMHDTLLPGTAMPLLHCQLLSKHDTRAWPWRYLLVMEIWLFTSDCFVTQA